MHRIKYNSKSWWFRPVSRFLYCLPMLNDVWDFFWCFTNGGHDLLNFLWPIEMCEKVKQLPCFIFFLLKHLLFWRVWPQQPSFFKIKPEWLVCKWRTSLSFRQKPVWLTWTFQRFCKIMLSSEISPADRLCMSVVWF